MHGNNIHTFYTPYACTLESINMAHFTSQIDHLVSRTNPENKISCLHDTDMMSWFFLKISLMTITQHALLYNFHTSNLIFEEIFFLKFLSMQPLPGREIAIDLDEMPGHRIGEEFAITPTRGTDVGGRLYHAGAHSSVSQQTHFTSETHSQKYS